MRGGDRLSLRLSSRQRFVLPADHGADGDLATEHRVLAKGFGPEAVAMAASSLADKADVSAAGDFLSDAAQVGSQFDVSRNAEQSVLESRAKPIRQLLFDR